RHDREAAHRSSRSVAEAESGEREVRVELIWLESGKQAGKQFPACFVYGAAPTLPVREGRKRNVMMGSRKLARLIFKLLLQQTWQRVRSAKRGAPHRQT